MVFQKKLYYGFNGYQVPPMPRGSRSARVKRSFRKKDRENPMCAFEMLAMVAGNLLLEKETSKPSSSIPSCSKDLKSTIKQEAWEDEKQPKLEPCDQGSCDESTLASENFHAGNFDKCKSKECTRISNSVIRHHPASVALRSEMHTKACDELKCAPLKRSEDEIRMTPKTKTCCAQTYSPGTAESHATRATMVEGKTADPLQMCDQNQANGMGGTDVNLFCMEDPMILDSKLPSLDSSDSSVETPLTGTYFSSNQNSSKCYDRVHNVDRYDDENSSRCTIPSTIFSKDFSFHCSEDRRIRKLLASKFWKVGPSLFRDGKPSNNDAQAKSIFRSRRMCYTRQRSQRSSFKRKRILQRDPGLTTNGSLGNGSRFKDSKKEEFLTAATFSEAQKPQFKPEDSQVKFSLKSLKVPELLIEMPETATVGTLKRAVLDTVTAIFQDGTKVGVIYQGKKVKDDNKTLLQAGLPNGIKTDSLSFSLEPISSRPRPRQTESEGSHLLQQYENESSERLPAADCGVPSSTHDLKNFHRECTESSNCCADKPMVPEDSATCTALADIDNSRALVPVHAMNVEALAAVPFQKKSKRSEHVQRRIRRPFSVVEVEALVQAVEVLGTGRWRDVKHRAFEDAKHRTYVDLKDKWKTLVHTARISPQQRRGEPVPQDLLDRVLVAHAYWSHQQPKLQGKQQQQKQQQQEEVEQNLLH